MKRLTLTHTYLRHIPFIFVCFNHHINLSPRWMYVFPLFTVENLIYLQDIYLFLKRKNVYFKWAHKHFYWWHCCFTTFSRYSLLKCTQSKRNNNKKCIQSLTMLFEKKKNEINNTVWQLSKLPVELLWMYPSIAMSMKNFITTLNFVASAVIMLIAAQQQKIMFTFIWVKMFFLYFYIYKIVQNKRKHRIFHGFDFQASFHASILWIFMNA